MTELVSANAHNVNEIASVQMGKQNENAKKAFRLPHWNVYDFEFVLFVFVSLNMSHCDPVSTYIDR